MFRTIFSGQRIFENLAGVVMVGGRGVGVGFVKENL